MNVECHNLHSGSNPFLPLPGWSLGQPHWALGPASPAAKSSGKVDCFQMLLGEVQDTQSCCEPELGTWPGAEPSASSCHAQSSVGVRDGVTEGPREENRAEASVTLYSITGQAREGLSSSALRWGSLTSSPGALLGTTE